MASLQLELGGAWKAYRTWACTARHHKKILDSLTSWSLYLAIGGAAAAILAEQLPPSQSVSVLGIFASAAVAIAAFLSQQAQASKRVDVWTRSRGAAESLKSGIYLYRTGASPFDKEDRAVQLSQRVEKVIHDMQPLEPRPPDAQPVPDQPLDVGSYIAGRVDDQVRFYERTAKRYQGRSDLCRAAAFVLAGIGTVLTLFSANHSVSVWAPVVATTTAALTAHLKNQQYQVLTATYTATALRLRSLLSEWSASNKTDADKPERNAFIQRCEDTMSAENGGWAALWSKHQ